MSELTHKPDCTCLGRREFIKAAGGGVAALAAGSALSAAPGLSAEQIDQDFAPGVPRKLRIDIHGHIYPLDYLDLLDRLGGSPTGTRIARIAKGSGSREELESRFQMMDRAGVKMQVLSCAPQLPYFEKKESAIEAARFINDSYANYVKTYPDRFVAYGTVPLPHVDAALEEMTRCLDKLGMVGVTMGTSVLTKSVADPMFDPFWEEMNRRGTILFFHPIGLGACSSLIQDLNLTWPIGAMIEDTVVVGHLIAKQIPQRFPRVRIIVPHLGGDISMQIFRIDNQKFLFLPPEAEKPSVTVKRLWFDTVGHAYPPALRVACEALGADRFLLGSDYPYEIGELYQRCVDFVKDPAAGLTADQAEAILDRNAQAMFRLRRK